MDANLIDLINQCLGIADDRGLSADKLIIIKIKSPDGSGESTQIVCSYSEPFDSVLPLNVTWIVSDPSSPDYKSAYKRISKDPANSKQNTWQLLTSYDDVFNPPQYYDETDLPEVTASIDEIQKHLDENIPTDDPHGAKAYTDQRVGTLQLGILNYLNSVNSKANRNSQRITELELGQNTLSEQVAQLLQTPKINSTVYVQEKPEEIWIVKHNFGKPEVMVQCYDDENVPFLPDKIDFLDENTALVIFSPIKIAGKAVVIGV